MAINPEVIQFANDWITKSNSYQEPDTKNLIDRYISLFIAYNAMYHQVAVQEYGEDEYKDAVASTKYVIKYITHSLYMNSIITDKDVSYRVAELANILNGNDFYIHRLKNGIISKDKDHALAKILSSNDTSQQAIGVVTFLYQVRCNIIHGAKSLTDNQRNVLEPACALLFKTVNVLMQTIRERN